MDEPTAGTAPRDRGSVMELVSALVRDSGVATLFTEHDVDVVFRFAARVIVLDRGRIIADGPPASVRADPRVQAVYLGTAPPGVRRARGPPGPGGAGAPWPRVWGFGRPRGAA